MTGGRIRNEAEGVIVRSLDEAAIERILTAVGRAFVPADLDRAKLKSALSFSRTWFNVASDGAPAREERRKVEAVAKAAAKLVELLSDHNTTGWVYGFLPGDAEPPGPAIQHLAAAAEKALERIDAGAAALAESPDQGSPFEWLVAVRLPKVFKQHFKRNAGVSRDSSNDGEAGGPYVRFVKATLAELNVKNGADSYKDETIVRAITRARKSESRRKR